MHRTHSPQRFRGLAFPARPSSQLGFSLIEITLSIGIIAFAFVALFGLLPVGLTTFRNAIDTNNEARIVQTFVSKVLAVDFTQVKATLDYDTTKEIYYFDEEGTLLDTLTQPVAKKRIERIYEAKLFITDEEVPLNPSKGTTASPNSQNIVVVFAHMASPAGAEFESPDKTGSLSKLKDYLKKPETRTFLRVRPVLVSKMDNQA